MTEPPPRDGQKTDPAGVAAIPPPAAETPAPPLPPSGRGGYRLDGQVSVDRLPAPSGPAPDALSRPDLRVRMRREFRIHGLSERLADAIASALGAPEQPFDCGARPDCADGCHWLSEGLQCVRRVDERRIEMAPTTPTSSAVGRCGDRAPTVLPPELDASMPAIICALPAGHPGWHRADGGAEWGDWEPDLSAVGGGPEVPPKSDLESFEVNAYWLNDGTAELEVGCSTCDWWHSFESATRVPLSELVATTAGHQCAGRMAEGETDGT